MTDMSCYGITRKAISGITKDYRKYCTELKSIVGQILFKKMLISKAKNERSCMDSESFSICTSQKYLCTIVLGIKERSREKFRRNEISAIRI